GELRKRSVVSDEDVTGPRRIDQLGSRRNQSRDRLQVCHGEIVDIHVLACDLHLEGIVRRRRDGWLLYRLLQKRRWRWLVQRRIAGECASGERLTKQLVHFLSALSHHRRYGIAVG